MPNLEARLVQDDGTDAPLGEKGEIWMRGPVVMKVYRFLCSSFHINVSIQWMSNLFIQGYLRNTSATVDSITPDGWFKTGDVATRSDDGYYTIVDRKKELIKYKGFQG